MAALVPLAHVGHWLWALYLPPVLIVGGSILGTRFKERKLPKDDPSASDQARD
jgi:hypothetical protein